MTADTAMKSRLDFNCLLRPRLISCDDEVVSFGKMLPRRRGDDISFNLFRQAKHIVATFAGIAVEVIVINIFDPTL